MNIIPKKPGLHYGADYNPEQWPRETWLEDAELMNEAGVDLVSVGIFSWSWLQPEVDRFEFDWLDDVLAILHEREISVNLATATASPPAWLAKLHPESLPVTAEGAILGPGGRQHYAPWSTAYRNYAAVLVRKLAERYGNHPALVSWHINNELACHVQESFDEETIQLWTQWLKKRYDSIETINISWNTAFWSQRFASFDEIPAPRCAPTIMNPAMVLDWRRFSAEAFLDITLREKAILGELTPDIPVNTNFVGWHDLPRIDHQKVAQEIDYISWDSYPDPSGGLAEVQANALGHDFMRSLKPGHPFILMEQATSAVNWRACNEVRAPGVCRNLSHQALARGADGVLFFQWRQSLAGAEQFHSSMLPSAGIEVGGHEHRIWTLTKQLGADLKSLQPIAGSTVDAEVAILVDYESIWFTEHESKPIQLDMRQEITRLHKPLWARNVPVDIHHPDDDLSAYQLLIAPSLMILSKANCNKIREFVANGGHVLFTTFSATVDETTRIHAGGLPGHLQDVFGYAFEEWLPYPEDYIGHAHSEFGELRWERLAETGYATTADVLAELKGDWYAGRPALTRNHYERGSAWFLGAHLIPESIDTVMEALLQSAEIKGVADSPEGVEVTLRQQGRQHFVHVINHNDQIVQLDDSRLHGTDLLTGTEIRDAWQLDAHGVACIAR